MRFINKTDYECPYCHGQLIDEERDGQEVRVCRSETCNMVGGRVFDVAEVGGHE